MIANLPSFVRVLTVVGLALGLACKAKEGEICRCAEDCRDGLVCVVEGSEVLEPGQWFEYTSFCPLRTPLGWMEGEYEMVAAGGERFAAAIGRFALEAPHTVN